MNEILKTLHPDELAALPRIIKRLKQQDGESWAVGDLLERLLKEA